ncbi:MAG: hypothetical protein IKV60_03420 [Rikenellaceae bacterium]|nr:hypothetical protein [Rikenellaceae bacterium]
MKTIFKTTILGLLLACVSFSAVAQIKTSYFMEGSTYRYDMNPALTPQRGYIKFPALSGFSMDFNNTLLSLDRFLYNKGGQTVTFMHSAVSSDEFLKKLNKNNSIGLDLNVPIFGLADYAKHYFWSFDMNLRTMMNANVPRDVFKLIKCLGEDVNMGNIRLDATAYLQTSLGFTFPIGEHIMFGFKVKGLLGLAHATANIDDLGLSLNKDAITATGHAYVDLNVPGIDFAGLGNKGDKLNLDLGLGETRANESGTIDLNNLATPYFDNMPRVIQSATKNGGVAFDFGVEVNLWQDHLRFSAAVVDLGWIWWNQSSGASIETSKVYGSFGGANLSNLINGGEFDINKEITHNLNELAITNRGSDGMVSRMATQLNIGGEFAFLRNSISVGLLSHSKFYESHTYSELTASLNFRPGKRKRFSATFSHSFLNSGWQSMGFALNLHGRGFNAFIGTDYIPLGFATKLTLDDSFSVPIPGDTFGLSYYAGISFSLHEAHFGKTLKEARQERRANKRAAKEAKYESSDY